MTKIEYSQERIHPLFLIIPIAFMLAGLFCFILALSSANSFLPLLLPLIFVVAGAAFLLIARKHARNNHMELQEIREKGRVLSAEILDVEEYKHYSSDGDGGTSVSYSYTFLVRYTDPETHESVTTESITTYKHYAPQSSRCQILLYNGKVLVEEADVAVVKNKQLIVVLVFFAIVLLITIIKWFA